MENITAINRKKINYIKLACLLISLISFPALITHASNPSEISGEILTVQMQNKTLKEVFSYLEKNSNYVFIYEEAVDLGKRVNVNISDKSIEDIIKEVFSSNGFSYVIKGRQVIVKNEKSTGLMSSPVTAQDAIVVRGTVTDHTGMPLVGVNVVVKGATIGTVTDIDGHFDLPNVPKGATLLFSYIGYKSQEVKALEKLTITLSEDNELLDEVVVVGYGTQKKVNMTGAVSSVKVDALDNRPVTNATNALAGLAAGLSVTNTGGGTPGLESPTIRIRGQGTLNNSDPLVVIDGMAGASISDINPQDIESISVLKDAASSAIYGSRAANGVILITTKKGSEGSARITYSGNVSFEKVAKRLNLVTDYADFMEIQNAGLLANGQAPRFSQGKIDEWRNDAGRNPTIYPNTDWQDHIYRSPSVVQNHTVTANGGSKTARYNLSFGYINNPGMIYHSNYKRYQMRANVDVDIKPWLTVGANAYGYVDYNNPSAGTAAEGGDVIWGYGAFNTVPGMTLYDPATDLYGGIQNPEEENVSNANPYRRMWFYKEDFPTISRRTVAKMYGRVTPVKGLTIDASYTYNAWDRRTEHHLTDRDLYRFTADGPVLLRAGVVRTYIRRYNYRNDFRASDVTARYEFKVDKLDASVMAGASQEYNKYDTDYYLKYDLVDESLTALDAASTLGRITGNYNEWAMRSYFGRINLVWDDKYMLEANLRADGSSRTEQTLGLFPVGIGRLAYHPGKIHGRLSGLVEFVETSCILRFTGK